MPKIGNELKRCRIQLRLTQPEMAARMNVSTTTIVNYETGKRLPDIDFLVDFAGECEKDLLSLLGLRIANSPSPKAASTRKLLDAARDALLAQKAQATVSIPLFHINDLASPASEAPPLQTADEIPQFSTVWLERELKADPAHLCLIPIDEDSMMPTLRPGDTILLDRRIAKPDREGIYVLRMNGVSLVKRMQTMPGGALKISSDNPAYETFTINQSDITDNNIAVLGRVVWVVWAGRRV